MSDAIPVLYIFLNKSLHMSAGKAASQAAHAVAMLDVGKDWKKAHEKKVVVLQAQDEWHMRNIREYLLERGYDSVRIIDEGITEVSPHSWTALAIPPMNQTDEVRELFKQFKSYRDNVRAFLEFDI